VRQSDTPANILSWPLKRPTQPETPNVQLNRRRRRSSTVKQWLPTALFIGSVAALVLLLVAVKMMISSATTPPTAAPIPTAAPAVETQAQAAAPQSRAPLSPAAPVAQGPAQPERPNGGVRFTSRPIEPSYTVAAGDNLWSIAQKNRSTVDAIQGINNLPANATLSVGQRLVMP